MLQMQEIEAIIEDVTALNEELLDKLRLLNFEKEYVQKGNKTVNLASFSVASNPTEQFNLFKNLIKWLFQLNEISSSEFSKYDDPLTVSTNIINECKKLQIPCQFPPLKLKAGSGEQVLTILNQLASKALKKRNFNLKTPKFEAIKNVQEQVGQDIKGEDEQLIEQAQINQDDDLDDKQQIGAAAIDQDKQIIQSAVNQNDWKLECQRVANKLKVQGKNDSKEWRTHIQSTRLCGDHIKKNFPNTRVILEKLNDQLMKTLEKISKSEKMINLNMSEVGEKYRTQSEELQKLSTHYNNLNTSIKQMNQNHRLITEKLQQIQAKTNQHSGTVTDNSPVVKIKESLMHITKEIKTMDVRIGVLSHTILQYKSKQRNMTSKTTKHIHADAQDLDQF